MKKKLFSILQYLVFLGGGIFLVWWQLKSMNPEEKLEFITSLENANYWVVLPVVVMSLMSHISRAMRWQILLQPLGYFPKLKNVLAVLMVGYMANAAVPRLGEVLKCTFLARYENLKVDKLFGSIILERVFDFLCFLVFIAITILIQINLVSDYFGKNLSAIADTQGTPLWIKAIIFTLLLGSLIFIVRFLLRRFPGNKMFIKISSFLRGIIEGFAAIKKLENFRMFFLHTLLIWVLYVMQIYVGFAAMQSTAHLGMGAAFSVLTLATLAMIATPGGIGSFPIFVMQTLVIYNIPDPQGKAFGWLLWGVNSLIFILSGLIALLLLPYMNKNKHEIRSANPE